MQKANKKKYKACIFFKKWSQTFSLQLTIDYVGNYRNSEEKDTRTIKLLRSLDTEPYAKKFIVFLYIHTHTKVEI